MNALSISLSRAVIVLFALAALLTLPAASPADAQATPGAMLIYGNYCGPGNRGPGHPPIDALDLACAHHDACYPPAGIMPACSCNRRLQVEASLVARDPRTQPQTRDMANFISSFAEALPCQ